MAKKQNLDASYMDWAEGVPQDIVDKFLSSSGAERIANLHGGMTKAQQRTAELEAHTAREAARVAALDDWATKHSDLYDRMPEWAPIIRSRRAEEVEQAMSGAKRDIEQKAADVDAALRLGTLTPEEALPIVVNLHKQYGTLSEQVESFKQFREHEVPRLVGAVEENFKNMNARTEGNTRVLLEYMTDAMEYLQQHPTRSPRKILETFVERNKERQYKTFQDIATDAYGEDDTEQLITQRAEERLAAAHKARQENGGQTEAPVTGSAIGPFRRQHAPVTPPPATTAGGVRTALLEHFHKSG